MQRLREDAVSRTCLPPASRFTGTQSLLVAPTSPPGSPTSHPPGLQRVRAPCLFIARMALFDRRANRFLGNVLGVRPRGIGHADKLWEFNPEEQVIVRCGCVQVGWWGKPRVVGCDGAGNSAHSALPQAVIHDGGDAHLRLSRYGTGTLGCSLRRSRSSCGAAACRCGAHTPCCRSVPSDKWLCRVVRASDALNTSTSCSTVP